MVFYYVEPEVAGELGPSTVMDTTVHPPDVSRLEYRFTDWLGDSIVESFPCYIVTDELGKQIQQGELDGATLDEVAVTLSPEAEELLDQPLPPWKWLKVTGQAFQSDFGISDDRRLVVSERAMDVLRQGALENADIEATEE
ncbi:MAG TPA: hypothetical protein VJX10_15280 [Pseudonocardiaceae bacterium]|nr:hypothetical protein [Pseudonocardiaceae bacterium]